MNLSVNSTAANTKGEVCFHCGSPGPHGADYRAAVDGRSEPMCCAGCAAVAGAIAAAGLTDYYRLRTELPQAGDTLPSAVRAQLEKPDYDVAAAQAEFAHGPQERREATLMLEGIRCAACVWLNERHVAGIPGVISFHINYVTQRAQLVWDARRVPLSDIVTAIEAIGYRAYPYEPSGEQQKFERERKKRLRELAVAGVFGMQVMMLAEALYAGHFFGMEPEFKILFEYLSLLLVLPVVLYAAAPFFIGALRDLRLKRAGIDVPIALGLVLAFGASVVSTLTQRGDVYYDAVVMFVFFLLGGRYFELSARRHAMYAIDALTPPLPTIALRIDKAGAIERVALSEIQIGDRVSIPAGEAVPVDGVVIAGGTRVDESLLTGESTPQSRSVGGRVIAGSINIESPVIVEVSAVGERTVLADIKRLVARAQAQRPRGAERADRAAVRLVAGVLIAAALAGLYWWNMAPDHALPIVVAMLVITCPCALALATPVVYTVAMQNLARAGLVVTNAGSMERFADVTDVVFDKTGTLTYGTPQLLSWRRVNRKTMVDLLSVAAALAAVSEHPLARALRAAATPFASARNVKQVTGGGISGDVNSKHYVLGSPAFVAEETGYELKDVTAREWCRTGHSVAVLGSVDGIEAVFAFADTVRDDARATVNALTRAGKRVWLLSGDHLDAAVQVANRVGIQHIHAGLTPQKKIEQIRHLQNTGAVVAMIGDGINDAPALAAADVSIAMGQGTRLAHSAATIVLLAPRLAPIIAVLEIARATRRVVRQNIAFAVVYNIVALPLAACGWVSPWVGALGMSFSSIAVTANALRLRNRSMRASMAPATRSQASAPKPCKSLNNNVDRSL